MDEGDLLGEDYPAVEETCILKPFVTKFVKSAE